MDLLRNGCQRIVVTGLGALTPLGKVKSLLEGLKAGRSGIRAHHPGLIRATWKFKSRAKSILTRRSISISKKPGAWLAVLRSPRSARVWPWKTQG